MYKSGNVQIYRKVDKNSTWYLNPDNKLPGREICITFLLILPISVYCEYMYIVKYNLRNSDEIKLLFMRLETFRRSFIPYALKLWNLLSVQDGTISRVDDFKTSLSEIFNTDSKILYYYGQRWANVYHARMRIGYSGLHYNLHTDLHVINSPSCRCGAPQETAYHYFMECILYDDHHLELIDVVFAICPFKLKTLMHGNEDLSYKDNCRIFDAVHK